jgi:hypothetical protein
LQANLDVPVIASSYSPASSLTLAEHTRYTTMKSIRALAVSAFLAAAAYAIPVSNAKLTNTGVSGVGCIGTVTLTAGCSVVNSGTITDNFFNPPYQLVSGPAGSSLQTVAVTQPGAGVPVGWLANNTTSRWITPNNLNAAMTDPAGIYVYTQTFTLASATQAKEITGQWASDNGGMLEFNGNAVSTTGSTDFGTWTPFTINSGFQSGLNTLTFTIMNNLSGPNQTPSGLRVEFASVSLPEAHEMTALSLMLGGLLLFGLKRRKANSVA